MLEIVLFTLIGAAIAVIIRLLWVQSGDRRTIQELEGALTQSQTEYQTYRFANPPTPQFVTASGSLEWPPNYQYTLPLSGVVGQLEYQVPSGYSGLNVPAKPEPAKQVEIEDRWKSVAKEE